MQKCYNAHKILLFENFFTFIHTFLHWHVISATMLLILNSNWLFRGCESSDSSLLKVQHISCSGALPDMHTFTPGTCTYALGYHVYTSDKALLSLAQLLLIVCVFAWVANFSFQFNTRKELILKIWRRNQNVGKVWKVWKIGWTDTGA